MMTKGCRRCWSVLGLFLAFSGGLVSSARAEPRSAEVNPYGIAGQTREEIHPTGRHWAVADIEQAARHSIASGKPFLYSSGGLFCRPRYEPRFRSLAAKLPIRAMGCGCLITATSMGEAVYARAFNNHVLALLSTQDRR